MSIKDCATYKPQLRLLFFLFLLVCSSCRPARDFVYFSDIAPDAHYTEKIENKEDVKIQPDDLLSIFVTSLSPEANILFNRGILPSPGGDKLTVAATPSSALSESYLVDAAGFIDFPVLGKIKVGGLSREEAKEMLTKSLVTYLKEPIVYVRFMNFRVTVVGEVNNASTFTVPTERLSILEALGLAGDMTPYGKRESVLIIREEGGERTIKRVNLNKKELLNSPFFYLHQNDVVYVEPDKALAGRVSNADKTARIIQVAASVVSLLLVIITQFILR